MPKTNNNKQQYVNDYSMWKCVGCEKEILTIGNNKLMATKVRLHTKTCQVLKEMELEGAIPETTIINQNRELHEGNGFNYQAARKKAMDKVGVDV